MAAFNVQGEESIVGIRHNQAAYLMAVLVICTAASGCKGNKDGDAPPAVGERAAAAPSAAKENAGAKPQAADPATAKTASGECPDGETRVPAEMGTWQIAATFEKYPDDEKLEAKLYKSDVELKVLAATTTEFYGKPLTLVGDLKLDDDYYGKYDEAKPTHYSFTFYVITDRLKEISVYAEKAKFRQLFEHVVKREFSGPFKIRVVTDAGHKSDNVFTLLDAEPQTAWMRSQCAHKRSP